MARYIYETEKYGIRTATKDDNEKVRELIKSGRIMEKLMGKEKENEEILDKVISSVYLKSNALKVIEDKNTKEFYGYIDMEADNDDIEGTIHLIEQVSLEELIELLKLSVTHDCSRNESCISFTVTLQK